MPSTHTIYRSHLLGNLNSLLLIDTNIQYLIVSIKEMYHIILEQKNFFNRLFGLLYYFLFISFVKLFRIR